MVSRSISQKHDLTPTSSLISVCLSDVSLFIWCQFVCCLFAGCAALSVDQHHSCFPDWINFDSFYFFCETEMTAESSILSDRSLSTLKHVSSGCSRVQWSQVTITEDWLLCSCPTSVFSHMDNQNNTWYKGMKMSQWKTAPKELKQDEFTPCGGKRAKCSCQQPSHVQHGSNHMSRCSGFTLAQIRESPSSFHVRGTAVSAAVSTDVSTAVRIGASAAVRAVNKRNCVLIKTVI